MLQEKLKESHYSPLQQNAEYFIWEFNTVDIQYICEKTFQHGLFKFELYKSKKVNQSIFLNFIPTHQSQIVNNIL